MDAALRQQMIEVARGYVRAPVPYTFSEREREALDPFFTNDNRRVFFFQNLPANVSSALLAMYSRQKNPRGIRGHFVDNMLPVLMRTDIGDDPEALDRVQAEYREQKLFTLDAILDSAARLRWDFTMFLKNAPDPGFWRELSRSVRVRRFLARWLDKFGHNSIARTGQLVFGVEDISILAAKSFEWGRPGAGYIELSTRYVDFTGKAAFPIGILLELLDQSVAKMAGHNIGEAFALYRALMGEHTDGTFPAFLRERWGSAVDAKSLVAGVHGESCDVLGNLLPCAALTQLGISVSGEALPELIKHLWLDATPENDALAELIAEEAPAVGADQFLHHMDISPWRRADWSYLRIPSRLGTRLTAPAPVYVEDLLYELFRDTERYEHCSGWANVVDELCRLERDPFDKLPAQFEHISATLRSVMTYRGWRDLHRMGLCTHHRSLVTPHLGFYRYPKPAPPELRQAFDRIHALNRAFWQACEVVGVPPVLRQYAMAMGNRVAYSVAANLREWEFCDWQRSGWNVNDEVRQEFLAAEAGLREQYLWWYRLAEVPDRPRVDLTPHYVFARGEQPYVLPEAA